MHSWKRRISVNWPHLVTRSCSYEKILSRERTLNLFVANIRHKLKTMRSISEIRFSNCF
jgi:hypothetical protein